MNILISNFNIILTNSSNNFSDSFFLNFKSFFYYLFLLKRKFIYLDIYTWNILEKNFFLIYSNQLQDIRFIKFFNEFDIFKYNPYSNNSSFNLNNSSTFNTSDYNSIESSSFFSNEFFFDEKVFFFFFFIGVNQYIFSFFCINLVLIILFDSIFFYEIFSIFFNKSYYFFILDFYLKIRTMVSGKIKSSLREIIQTVKFSYVVNLFFIIFIFNLSNLIPEFSSLTSYIIYIFFFTFVIILNLFFQIFKVYWISSLKKFKNIDSKWYSGIYPCINSIITFFFRILSLCIRLFVNMLAGHLLIGMIQHFIYISFFLDLLSIFFSFNF